MTTYFPESTLTATEEACQREPLVARTRLAILKLEKEGHRGGWDSRINAPTIFRFKSDPVRQFVATYPSPALTRALQQGCDVTGGDVGEACQLLAEGLEGARKVLIQLGLGPNYAMAAGERIGHSFYGYALRAEGWAAPRSEPDQTYTERVEAAAREKRISQLPDRVETRMVNLVARDGLQWWCMRRRAMPPAECIMSRPEGDAQAVGLVVNALGLMTSAAAAAIIPIPDLAQWPGGSMG